MNKSIRFLNILESKSLTQDVKDKIIALSKEGKTLKEISLELNPNDYRKTYYMVRHYLSNNKIPYHIDNYKSSDSDVQSIKDLTDLGKSNKEIEIETGMSKTSIRASQIRHGIKTNNNIKAITPEIEKKIREMVDSGHWVSEISQYLGISASTVLRYLKINRIEYTKRHAGRGSKITPEMSDKIKDMLSTGMNPAEISKELGLSTIRSEIERNPDKYGTGFSWEKPVDYSRVNKYLKDGDYNDRDPDESKVSKLLNLLSVWQA